MTEARDDDIDFGADAGQQHEASAGAALRRVSDMAAVLMRAIERLRAAESELEAAEAEYRRIAEGDFPELLREVGLGEFTLTDGTKIVVDEDVRCGISEERAQAAFKWMRDHGYGGLIKTELSISFAKGEEQQVRQVVAAIRELGRNPDVKDTVHWQTLKSFVKERRAAGSELPDETFGVHPITTTLLAAPGKRPGKPKRRYEKKK